MVSVQDWRVCLTGFLVGMLATGVVFHFLIGQMKLTQQELIVLHSEAQIREKYLRSNLTACKDETTRLRHKSDGLDTDLKNAQQQKAKLTKDSEQQKKDIEALNKNSTEVKAKIAELEEKGQLLGVRLNETKIALVAAEKKAKSWI